MQGNSQRLGAQLAQGLSQIKSEHITGFSSGFTGAWKELGVFASSLVTLPLNIPPLRFPLEQKREVFCNQFKGTI